MRKIRGTGIYLDQIPEENLFNKKTYFTNRELLKLNESPSIDTDEFDKSKLSDDLDLLTQKYIDGEVEEIPIQLTGSRKFNKTLYYVPYIPKIPRDNYFLFDEDAGEISFISQIQKTKINMVPGVVGVQTSLWKNPESTSMYDRIASTIAFQVLLKRYSGLMSDGIQSEKAKKLWYHMCLEAYKHPKDFLVAVVYFNRHLHSNNPEGTEFQIINQNNFEEEFELAYDIRMQRTSHHRANMRILIANR